MVTLKPAAEAEMAVVNNNNDKIKMTKKVFLNLILLDIFRLYYIF